MRVLVGHTNQMPELNRRQPLPGRENCADAILAFGNGYQQVGHEPGMRWNDLLANCPPRWRPDVYIHWSPEYNAIPEGLETAECLTVGAFGDWNLGGQAMRAAAGIFDVLYADRNGGDILRKAGFTNVRHAPLWAFDPEMHRRLPGMARDIDVLMLGNFNPAVQGERLRWVARVAKLSRQHRVLLTSGIYGEDYVRLMNRAKIVFNRSIRGEMNMRAYEAPACGALLFYERENREIADFLTDRQECVLYGEDDLETLLDYYLAPENAPERERIAEAGWKKIQSHSYAHHFARMLAELEPLTKTQSKRQRIFCMGRPEQQARNRAAQWLVSAERTIAGRLDSFLMTAPLSESDRVAFRAVLLGEWANGLPESAEKNICLSAALALSPPWPLPFGEGGGGRADGVSTPSVSLIPRFNHGFLLLAAGRMAEAETVLRETFVLLKEAGAENLTGPLYPRRFDGLTVELERIYGAFPPGSAEWAAALKSLLLTRIGLTLSELAYNAADFDAAVTYAEQAAENLPEFETVQLALARAYRVQGRTSEALAAYARSRKFTPFLLAGWEEAVRLLLDTERPQEAIALLNELLPILDGCPLFAPQRPPFETLRFQAHQMARQASTTGPRPTCLLAFPDWNTNTDWQEIVRAFAATYRPHEPVVLLLRADPKAFPDAPALLTAIQTYLAQTLQIPADALPNITLISQPLAPDERWKLFAAANALLQTTALPAPLERLAETTQIARRTLDDLRAA